MKKELAKDAEKDLLLEVKGIDLSLIPIYAIQRMAAFLLRKMEEEQNEK